MATQVDISLITLNVSKVKFSIKMYRVAAWITKENPSICWVHETHLSLKDKYRFRMEGKESIIQANRKFKKLGTPYVYGIAFWIE